MRRTGSGALIEQDQSSLTDQERHKLLHAWNRTHVDYPLDTCLHHLFEAQAERTPNAIAVSFPPRDPSEGDGESLTYQELNNRANQLAHHLRRFGVGPDIQVGVFMERSVEMVVALYGILKAGGAYVPLDPEYPSERISFMVEDTQVSVLLTQSHLAERLPVHSAKVICLDTEWEVIGEEPEHNPAIEMTSDNLAYVIYTSGSTGKPKGVMNHHRGIVNRLLWMQDEYGLTVEDRVLQKTPYSFDVSVWEFFWPLQVGARLVVAQPGGHKDAAYLVRLIVETGITTLHFVPSMLQIFLDGKGVEQCMSLKRVICSGEALPYELQSRFFDCLGAELHNLYGPTEAAIDVTYWACQGDHQSRIVPIGRPVANTQLYILDERMQPVAIGVEGEVHIGGVQVARGYLNRPELTAERFVQDPFSEDPNARLYKTGDLARYLPDGNIEFLGRMDFQVKIRGFRVELGEIEAMLDTHPSLRQTVVTLRDNRSGGKQLVAYCVPRRGQSATIGELRNFLLKSLPDYMVPAIFVLLDDMPLTPNGKVDRQGLPEPITRRPDLAQPYVPPRSELERYIAGLWCDLLAMDRVGAHDKFFELGGDSLQAAEFINRLQEELGEFVYVVTVFEAPSPAEYAAFLERDYAAALTRRFGQQTAVSGRQAGDPLPKLDTSALTRFQKCVPRLPAWQDSEPVAEPNPPAIFILAPPRSGTTLLRVMLAGHPRLFAAAELQLLGFNTLAERRFAFCGKFSLWLEGTIRSIMDIQGCDADEAKHIMTAYEQQGYTTKQFYRLLQDWLGEQLLVDKSPSYVLDPTALEKAERDFDSPLYIHLVRHPYAMVRSFEDYHMDQVLFLKKHDFTPRQLGELVWLSSHRNTVAFLDGVPQDRWCRIRFEDLVGQPQATMQSLCERLNLTFHHDLLEPYKDIDQKMTDGIYANSTPMGDTKFLAHQRVDPKVAERWKAVQTDNFLSAMTWEMATHFGYASPATPSTCEHPLERRRTHASQRRQTLDQRRRGRQRQS